MNPSKFIPVTLLALILPWVSDAFGWVVALAHQVQVGVSIIEGHGIPLFSKRALGWQFSFGGAESHREVIAEELGF